MNENKRKFHYAWIILLAISIIVGIGKGTVNNITGLFIPDVTGDLGIGLGTLTQGVEADVGRTAVFLASEDADYINKRLWLM